MRFAFFNAKPYDQQYFAEANGAFRHEIAFLEARLQDATVTLMAGLRQSALCE